MVSKSMLVEFVECMVPPFNEDTLPNKPQHYKLNTEFANAI